MRSRQLELRSGAKVTTPLLVPSLSSKGFSFRSDGRSEVATYLEVAGDALFESLLISAYDLEHEHLPDVDKLLHGDPWSTVYANPTLLVIDSGGYELSPGWDEADTVRGLCSPLPFDAGAHERLVDRLPRDLDLLVVSYDHIDVGDNRPDYSEQVESALAFFGDRRHLMSDVLLRPPAGQTYVDPVGIEPTVGALDQFDVLGVTEKEAGDSLFSRLVTVARLRRQLDQGGVAVPLHIFGVLDPLLVTLYFMAGAEIFDGLTWLRYCHHAGLSVYREAAAILGGHIDTPSDVRGAIAQLEYLGGLRVLKRTLQHWVEVDGDVSVLDHHRGPIRNIQHRLNHILEEGIY